MSLVKIRAFMPAPGLPSVGTVILDSPMCNNEKRLDHHPITAQYGRPTGSPVSRISGTDLVKIRTFKGTSGHFYDEKRINEYPVIDPNGCPTGTPVSSGLRGLGTMIVSGGLCE
jgi:hypothetical protein